MAEMITDEQLEAAKKKQAEAKKKAAQEPSLGDLPKRKPPAGKTITDADLKKVKGGGPSQTFKTEYERRVYEEKKKREATARRSELQK